MKNDGKKKRREQNNSESKRNKISHARTEIHASNLTECRHRMRFRIWLADWMAVNINTIIIILVHTNALIHSLRRLSSRSLTHSHAHIPTHSPKHTYEWMAVFFLCFVCYLILIGFSFSFRIYIFHSSIRAMPSLLPSLSFSLASALHVQLSLLPTCMLLRNIMNVF